MDNPYATVDKKALEEAKRVQEEYERSLKRGKEEQARSMQARDDIKTNASSNLLSAPGASNIGGSPSNINSNRSSNVSASAYGDDSTLDEKTLAKKRKAEEQRRLREAEYQRKIEERKQADQKFRELQDKKDQSKQQAPQTENQQAATSMPLSAKLTEEEEQAKQRKIEEQRRQREEEYQRKQQEQKQADSKFREQ